MIRKYWVKLWNWFAGFFIKKKPVLPRHQTPATDVLDEYVTFNYHGQLITLTHPQKLFWDRHATRKEKHGTAQKIAKQISKGELIIQKINGKKVLIKNKDYDAKARATAEAKTARE